MNGKQITRIVIVDNHLLFREGICSMLANHPQIQVVGSVGNRQDALILASESEPHIILLELAMEGEPCLNLISELIERTSHSKIILVTGITDREIHLLAVKHGAKGVVEKGTTSKRVLLKAIEKVASGEAWIDRTLVARMLDDFVPRNQDLTQDLTNHRIQQLSGREQEIIALVCGGMKPKEIANHLSLSVSTIRHHLSAIYEKLHVSSLTDLIIFSFKHGIVELPT